ncbi:12001_t:CDS:1, partial [Gigaspora rosea]
LIPSARKHDPILPKYLRAQILALMPEQCESVPLSELLLILLILPR